MQTPGSSDGGDGAGPRTGPAGRAGEGEVLFSGSGLEALTQSFADLAGPGGVDEALFRVGRRWGRSEAERARTEGAEGTEGAEQSWLERGLERLATLGLAKVALERFELRRDEGECRFEGRVLEDSGVRFLDANDPEPAGAICGLTSGYLTGLLAAVTGMDVVCEPLLCAYDCSIEHVRKGCPITIVPAASHASSVSSRPAPSGSARFVLKSLGIAFGEGDISLDDVIENTADAILLIDLENVIRFWSRGAERMFLFSREECVGRKIGFIVPPDLHGNDELGWLQRRLQTEGSVINHLTRRVRKDGHELWVNLTRTPLHDNRGQVIGSTAIIRDVSALRRTEEELVRARELAMIGELAAKVAHEVKNPLAGISAAIQLLARDVPAGDRRREIFDEVGLAIRRLDETVLDLLRFARPIPPRLTPTDLSHFIADVLLPLRRNKDVARQQIQILVAEGLVLPLDAKQLSHVFTNLFLNSAQAMPEGGTLRVEAQPRGAEVVIDVHDNGRGVPEEELSAIFDPFHTTKSQGTGLGLSIAKKNVESHGGTIEVESRVGEGTRFRITLPGLTDASRLRHPRRG